jgi:hypothetical protein
MNSVFFFTDYNIYTYVAFRKRQPFVNRNPFTNRRRLLPIYTCYVHIVLVSKVRGEALYKNKSEEEDIYVVSPKRFKIS